MSDPDDIFHGATPPQQVAPYIARLQEAVFDLGRQVARLEERMGGVEDGIRQTGGDLSLLSDSVLQLNRQAVLALEGMSASLKRDLQIHAQLTSLIESIKSTDTELRKQREHIDQMMVEIFEKSARG